MHEPRCDPAPSAVTGLAVTEAQPFIGRVAIVTGGGSGIGQAIALAYARRGGTVVILGRSQDKLDVTACPHGGSPRRTRSPRRRCSCLRTAAATSPGTR